MKLIQLYLLLLFFTSLGLSAQNQTDIKFVNTGAINIEGIMYVDCDMQMKNSSASTGRDVEVVLNGTTELKGSFYHDAEKHVFVTENNDWSTKSRPRGITSSTGIFRFVEQNSGGKRYISSSDTVAFDRVSNYITFPNLEIATNDQIYIPSTMGLDARTITREAANTGTLYLSSNIVSQKSMIYDASLRVTGDYDDEKNKYVYPVTPGSVIVEKRVREFRQTSSGGECTMLMPFAAPFTNMRSGYFAGNWVRRPLLDPEKNSFYYHYANRDTNPKDGVIDSDQYIIDPYTNLTASEAYLIRLQKAGGSMTEEYANLGITSSELEGAHDKDKFLMHGIPYPSLGVCSTPKELFAGTPVLSRTVQTGKAHTQNWVVGNSYTSALNTEEIANYLMNTINSYFVTNIYIYHHGTAGYMTYSMWNGSSVTDNLPDIHSMSVFMIAASALNTISETIEIGPEFQVHTGGIASADSFSEENILKRSSLANTNELKILLYPTDNPYVYDYTSIKLHKNAATGSDNYDISKLRNTGSKLFTLYGNNESNASLQQNALPYNAEKALLSVSPAVEKMNCTLKAQQADRFDTETVLLYDVKLNQWHDFQQNDSYSFVLSPADNADRFEIHFKPRTVTNITENAAGWYGFNNQNQLIIRNLDDSSIGTSALIHNTSGVLQIKELIRDIPEKHIDISMLTEGIYLLSLKGKTIKFIK